MTIDLEKSTADGRRALRAAGRRAAKAVDQARSLDVPTMSELGHHLDGVPAALEHAVERPVRAAERTGRAVKRTGLVPANARRRTGLRTTGIVLALGVVVAVVVVATKKRRAADPPVTADPFGTAVRAADEAGRAASSAVRA